MSWPGQVNTDETSANSFLANAEESESLLSYDAEGSSYEEDVGEILSSATSVDASASPEAIKAPFPHRIDNTSVVPLSKEETPYKGSPTIASASSSSFGFHLAQFTVPHDTVTSSCQAKIGVKDQENHYLADTTAALIEELVIDLGADEEVSNVELHAQELAYQQDLFEATQREKSFALPDPTSQQGAEKDSITLKMLKQPKKAKVKMIDPVYEGPLCEKRNEAVVRDKKGMEIDDIYDQKSSKAGISSKVKPPLKAPAAVAATHRKGSKQQRTLRDTEPRSNYVKECYSAQQTLKATAAETLARAIFGEQEAVYLAKNYDYSFELYSDGKVLGTILNESSSTETASQTMEEDAPVVGIVASIDEASQASGPVYTEAEMQWEETTKMEVQEIDLIKPVLTFLSFDDAPSNRCRIAQRPALGKEVDSMTVIGPMRSFCQICYNISSNDRHQLADTVSRSTLVGQEEMNTCKDPDGKESEARELNQSDELFDEAEIDLQPGSDEEQAIDALQSLAQGALATPSQDLETKEVDDVLHNDVEMAETLGEETSIAVAKETDESVVDNEAATIVELEEAQQEEAQVEAVKTAQPTKEEKAAKREEAKRLRQLAAEHQGPRRTGRSRNNLVNYCESSRASKKIKEEEIEDSALVTLAPPAPSSPFPDLPFGDRAAKRKAAEMITSSSTGHLYVNGKTSVQHPKKKGRLTT